jgi:adenylate cyclase
MIDEETRFQAGDRIVARELDSIAVFGREEPFPVFELVGMAGEVSADDLEAFEIYAAGLADYRAGQWEGAVSLFGQALGLRPADTPSKVMIERAGRLLDVEPDGWDGVYRLMAK